MQQQVIAEAVKIRQVEKEQEIKVQEAEILRREHELIATVLKPAEVERRRIETLAEAERQRTMLEAEGRASAIRAQGEAEAEIIFKKGEAEAKAMTVKAEAYQEWNQSAVVDKLITGMPEVVRALAEPLSNVDQDHRRIDGRRCSRGHEQSDRRPDADRCADSGAVRDTVRDADARASRQSASDRRENRHRTKPRGRGQRRLRWHCMERVAMLIRANLNDLIDKAEDPEKMLKQVILDMQNQFMQVKTQVAIAMADQHLLEKKLNENDQAVMWMRKAELAVEKQQDEMARPALERVLSYRQLCESFRQQSEDQQVQVENLKGALHKLEQKLIEAQSRSEILASRHRRARALGKSAEARAAMVEGARAATFDRMKDKVDQEEALSLAKHAMAEGDLQERLLALDREDEVEQLLRAIKEHKNSRSLTT